MYMGRFSQILTLPALLAINGNKMFLHCINYINYSN